jgi:Capsule assembly protein Wzi
MFMFIVNRAYADYAEDLMDKTMDFTKTQEEAGQRYIIKPVSKITVEDFTYSYSNNAKGTSYCFENSEGRCIDQPNNAVVTIEGKGKYDDRFYVYYKAERTEEGQLRLKKAYGLLRMGIWSLEYGKDTIWVGPGYHGSFLLSNNAEGYMLVRLRTEEPFRLPWIFSNIGEFKYDIFRGWSENFSILGQTLQWRPMPLLEFGANEVVSIYPGYHFDIDQYPKLFIPQAYAYYDQNGNFITPTKLKSSIDAILDMPFLSKVSPFVTGKLYAEYAGNDSFSYYQSIDRKWVWPFGFDYLNIAWMAGLFLTTGNVDYHFEYRQNYVSYPLFYDYYTAYGVTYARRQGPWYTDPINVRYGMITGDEMGNDADDYYFEITLRHEPGSLKVYYSQERHGLAANVTYPPEHRYEYGLRPTYKINNVTLFADLIYNHYKNVNYSTDPTLFDIHPGTELDTFIVGLGASIGF